MRLLITLLFGLILALAATSLNCYVGFTDTKAGHEKYKLTCEDDNKFCILMESVPDPSRGYNKAEYDANCDDQSYCKKTGVTNYTDLIITCCQTNLCNDFA